MAGPQFYGRVVQCRQDINKCHQVFLIMEIEYAFSYPSYRQQNKTVKGKPGNGNSSLTVFIQNKKVQKICQNR